MRDVDGCFVVVFGAKIAAGDGTNAFSRFIDGAVAEGDGNGRAGIVSGINVVDVEKRTDLPGEDVVAVLVEGPVVVGTELVLAATGTAFKGGLALVIGLVLAVVGTCALGVAVELALAAV